MHIFFAHIMNRSSIAAPFSSKIFAIPGGRLAPAPCGEGGVLLKQSVEVPRRFLKSAVKPNQNHWWSMIINDDLS